MRAETLTAIGAIASLLLFGRPAHAVDLKLIVATPMTGVVNDVGVEFRRSSGHRLTTTFVSGPVVKTRNRRRSTFRCRSVDHACDRYPDQGGQAQR